MFLSCCLTNYETNYSLSELEVACLVWCCKQLRMLLYSNRYRIVILTDHDSICGIVNRTNLDTISTNHTNRRLVNTSIYLTAYLLDVYHLPGRFNLIPDTLSHLKTPEDTETQQCNEEPMLDTLWDEVPPIDIPAPVLFLSKTQITDKICQQFTDSYKADRIYNKIIQDLKPHGTRENEDILNTSKAGNPFRIAGSLLYNCDLNRTQRLVILFMLIPEILVESHDQKHHLECDQMI